MELSKERMLELARFGKSGATTTEELLSFFNDDAQLDPFAPDGIVRIDPRDSQRIIYASKRGKRARNFNGPIKDFEQEQQTITVNCPICSGNTTEIWSYSELSHGHTFINKNLFPMLMPISAQQCSEDQNSAHGYHFLQWVSTDHFVDWHNISQADGEIVFNQLLSLEKYLLNVSNGHVCIIKNYGREVGGSQAHAHQQIACTNVMPGSMVNDCNYFEKNGSTFSADLLNNLDPSLVVKDYQSAILLAPPFMRRPLMTILALKDSNKKHLYQLTTQEVSDLVAGIRQMARSYIHLMPLMKRSPAYCITFHNGPGAGIYLEFHPYTQEKGGFEHLGLWVSTMLPEEAAQILSSFK